MRISDWSSDVCSSDLLDLSDRPGRPSEHRELPAAAGGLATAGAARLSDLLPIQSRCAGRLLSGTWHRRCEPEAGDDGRRDRGRSEEHTSELQSLMRISYAVFCLKKKNTKTVNTAINCE